MGNDREPYITEIDGEVLIVSDTEDDPVATEMLDYEREAASNPANSDQYIPDPKAREWAKSTKRMPETFYKGVVPEGFTRMCKNDRCTNMVAPSKNPGVLKLFCNPRCGQRYHARLWSKRNVNSTGWALERDSQGVPERFNRVKPLNSKVAEKRYHGHLEINVCPNVIEGRSRCPGRSNPSSVLTMPRCLIYATLVDDMKEQWAKERYEVYTRQWTSNDGEWLVDRSLDPDLRIHMDHMYDDSKMGGGVIEGNFIAPSEIIIT